MNNDIREDNNYLNKSEENPPILGSWKKLYSAVFISLVIMVLFFYFFTKAFE